MTSLSLLSPAKLNLFLHITGRRPDGYHNLQTLFQLLDYGDTLEFALTPGTQIRLTPELPGVPNEQNLIVRAARLLEPYKSFTAGIDIHLTKRLPMGGGIGGGSSNAATALVALNHLWQCGLTRPQLHDLALRLGADVPVFVNAQTAWAEGVGERLQAIEMAPKWFLVVQPDCQISTAEIFSNKHLTRDSQPITVAAFLEQGGKNDCQAVVRALYPEVDKALKTLEFFCQTAIMTGTGACVFASFESSEEARQVQQQLPDSLNSFVARGVNQSPLFNWLPAS